MELALAIVLLIVGFVVLIKGADFLVDGASAIARRFSISDMIIGLTIVSMGTSAPELVVNLGAAMAGKDAMIFGNVLGSNIFNTCLILGVAGMIYPLAVQRATVRIELPFSILIVVLVFVLSNDVMLFGREENLFSRMDGAVLMAIFLVFLAYVYRSAKVPTKTADSEEIKRHLEGVLDADSISVDGEKVTTDEAPKGAMFKDIAWVVLGMGGLVLGGNLVLDNAVFLAKMLGMTDRVIGLTVIAIGTSLPELATSAVAALKKNSDIAVGNVVGSNIFNVLLVLGASGMLVPAGKSINYDIASNFDIYFLLTASAVLILFIFMGRKGSDEGIATYQVERWQAAVLFVGVVGYIVSLFL